jgi:hypothetical protein
MGLPGPPALASEPFAPLLSYARCLVRLEDKPVLATRVTEEWSLPVIPEKPLGRKEFTVFLPACSVPRRPRE